MTLTVLSTTCRTKRYSDEKKELAMINVLKLNLDLGIEITLLRGLRLSV